MRIQPAPMSKPLPRHNKVCWLNTGNARPLPAVRQIISTENLTGEQKTLR